MPISFIAGSAGSEVFATNPTWSIDGPAGLVVGDLILLGVETSAAHAITTPPSGFTEIGTQAEAANDGQLRLYYKLAGVAEAGPYSITFTATQAGGGFWAAWRGVHQTTPIDVASILAAVAAGTTQTLGPITTVTTGAMIVGVVSCDPAAGTNTYAWDAPATERLDTTFSAATTCYATLADFLKGVAGAQSLSGTISASEATTTAIIALRPAPMLLSRSRRAAAVAGPAFAGSFN